MTENKPSKSLFAEIKGLLDQARSHLYRTVNTTMVMTYFQIGKLIV